MIGWLYDLVRPYRPVQSAALSGSPKTATFPSIGKIPRGSYFTIGSEEAVLFVRRWRWQR